MLNILNKQLKHKHTLYMILMHAQIHPETRKPQSVINNEHINIIISEPDITTEECRENLKHIHSSITSQYFSSGKNNKVTNITSYDIHSLKQTLQGHIHTKLELFVAGFGKTGYEQKPFFQSSHVFWDKNEEIRVSFKVMTFF